MADLPAQLAAMVAEHESIVANRAVIVRWAKRSPWYKAAQENPNARVGDFLHNAIIDALHKIKT